jgi:hypothetical protein
MAIGSFHATGRCVSQNGNQIVRQIEFPLIPQENSLEGHEKLGFEINWVKQL